MSATFWFAVLGCLTAVVIGLWVTEPRRSRGPRSTHDWLTDLMLSAWAVGLLALISATALHMIGA